MVLYKTYILRILCTSMVTTSEERHRQFRKNPAKSDEVGQRIQIENLQGMVEDTWITLITATKT